jgi:hypothetical protein
MLRRRYGHAQDVKVEVVLQSQAQYERDLTTE